MATMRAKMRVVNVVAFKDDAGNTTYENLAFSAVAANSYGGDGADEDNTYARYTPTANLQMSIANSALFNQFKEGDVFYVDFERVPAPGAAAVEQPTEEPPAQE